MPVSVSSMAHCAACPAGLCSLLGYLLGSIPFGLILTRLAGPRRHPRHRLGQYRRDQRAAHRPQGPRRRDAHPRRAEGHRRRSDRLAQWGLYGALAAGLGAFLGHCFPVWLKFKGGKGVATFLGVLLGLHWPTMVFPRCLARHGGATRYSSLSALVASVAAPIVLLLFGEYEIAGLAALLTVIIWMGTAPIEALLAGEESRIGAK